MTGNTRKYLADLANRKGVILPDMQEASQAAASDKIEELKTLPDKEFAELSEKDVAEVKGAIDKINKEMNKWTFAE